MDGAQFDRLSRLVTRPATRRAAVRVAATAALGFGLGERASGKKRKKRCPSCGPCQQCQRQGRKRRCVAQGSDVACLDGSGVCVDGTCCLPATCASLGRTCGPAPDGCGRTLACGTCGSGATPSCKAGTCAACSATCGASCTLCYRRPDGSTACGIPSAADCGQTCATDADCPSSAPFCAAAYTVRATNLTGSLPGDCGLAVPGICASFAPC